MKAARHTAVPFLANHFGLMECLSLLPMLARLTYGNQKLGICFAMHCAGRATLTQWWSWAR